MEDRALGTQLERMARSRAFVGAGRMLPLLAYLVDCTARTGARPDQRRIAIDVFGRGEDFDPGSDAIVRVEVGRLRHKLREYYATDGCGEAQIIEVPLGSYGVELRPRDRAPYTYPASLPQQQISHTVTPDGITLAYSTIGDGYPLVMLPHWLSHLEADIRNPLIQHYWVELSRRFRLIRYDTRGFGLSDRAVPDFAFDALVTDLETVVDALRLEKFGLFGPSGGASVGTAYAARHPERVSHLVLLGGFIRGARRSGDPRGKEWADTVESLIRIGWGQSHSRFRHVFCTVLVPNGTDEQYRWMDDAQLAAGSAGNVERYARIINDFDLTEEASSVSAPTLIAHGVREALPLVEARHAADRIPNTRLVLLPTENHLLLPDGPAWPLFLRELDAFFGRVPGDTRAPAATALDASSA